MALEDWMIPHDWQYPEWFDDGRLPHHWHNYVSAQVKQMWDSFSDEQKKALAAGFAEASLREEWD